MRAITDPTGAVLASYTFDPWGKVSAQSGTFSNPYRYGGEYQDDQSSLYYLRARYYLPDIGRFTSPDSYAGDPGDPLSLNLYTYVQNSPLRYLDPTGHVPAACYDDPFGQMLAGLASSLFNFIPYVGEAKGLYEAISGQDLFTGQHLSWGQRLLSAVPFVGGIGRELSGLARLGGEAGEGYSLARSAQSFIQDEGGFVRADRLTAGYQAESRGMNLQLFARAAEETNGPLALHPGRPGTVIRNALEPHEFAQAREIVQFRGGEFEGAPARSYPGIDGKLDGKTVSLKQYTGKSPTGVLKHASRAEAQAQAAGYSGVEVYIDAKNVSKDVLLDFSQNGGLSRIPSQGTIDRIYVLTSGGWVVIN